MVLMPGAWNYSHCSSPMDTWSVAFMITRCTSILFHPSYHPISALLVALHFITPATSSWSSPSSFYCCWLSVSHLALHKYSWLKEGCWQESVQSCPAFYCLCCPQLIFIVFLTSRAWPDPSCNSCWLHAAFFHCLWAALDLWLSGSFLIHFACWKLAGNCEETLS